MNDLCLVIIFNHKYDKNIPMLRDIYKERFSSIFFIVPFYTGTDEDVITVYESSYQFQGYITQAYDALKKQNCKHYLFIGDDLILNPCLNEKNILHVLNLKEGDGFIESLTPLNKTTYWHYSRFYDVNNAFKTKAVNYINEIPSIDFARKKALEYGWSDFKITNHIKCAKIPIKHVRNRMIELSRRVLEPFYLDYPLVTGYSDFFVLPSNILDSFAQLSGVFSAMRLFVEIAIPTAIFLLLDKKNIKTQSDITMLTPKLWWITDTAKEFEKKCNYKISNMEKYWPDKYVYLHPIKLSKWEKEEV